MISRWNRGFVAGALAILAIGISGDCNAANESSAKPAEKPASEAKVATTLDNLKTAYISESIAKARYDAFAGKAAEEGYKSVATLFRATAASQEILIKKHAAMLPKLGGALPDLKPPAMTVKSTKENLEAALAADIGAKNTQYPVFAKQAEAEKNVAAVYGFKGAVTAETEYVKFFKQALADLDGWKAEGKTFAVCQVCSFLVMGPPPATCPICAAPGEKFTVIK